MDSQENKFALSDIKCVLKYRKTCMVSLQNPVGKTSK